MMALSISWLISLFCFSSRDVISSTVIGIPGVSVAFAFALSFSATARSASRKAFLYSSDGLATSHSLQLCSPSPGTGQLWYRAPRAPQMHSGFGGRSGSGFLMMFLAPRPWSGGSGFAAAGGFGRRRTLGGIFVVPKRWSRYMVDLRSRGIRAMSLLETGLRISWGIRISQGLDSQARRILVRDPERCI